MPHKPVYSVHDFFSFYWAGRDCNWDGDWAGGVSLGRMVWHHAPEKNEEEERIVPHPSHLWHLGVSYGQRGKQSGPSAHLVSGANITADARWCETAACLRDG